jgi:hypothetical protein
MNKLIMGRRDQVLVAAALPAIHREAMSLLDTFQAPRLAIAFPIKFFISSVMKLPIMSFGSFA